MFSYKDNPEHTWLLTNFSPCIMGCTSSAPNMAAPNPNATEKKIEYIEEEAGQSMSEDDDIIAAEQENGNNEFKVLPSCDTLADPIQLDSNNKSIDTSNFDLEKDLIIKEQVTENENIAKGVSSEEKKKEDKLSSLEDVVEKVVELYGTERLISNTQAVADPADQIDISIENVKEGTESINEDQDPEDKFEEQKEKPPEEVTSPSQSTSSRATRWEALADIAAELPPSLTVDPLTGQIYALSK